MANPVVNATLNKGTSYLPGEAVTVTWTVTDADNSTETLVLEGVDSQGNAVSATVVLNRQDTFTMNRVYWQRTATNLTVNNATRTATGTVPTV
jgi:hypothetical protein